MHYLLDTSVFIYLVQEPNRLSTHLQDIIRNAENSIKLSVVSVWEIAIKQAIGKFPIEFNPLEMAQDYNFDWLPITHSVYSALRDLPLHHRDPFDRLLIAQAITGGFTLLSSDRQFERYPVSVMF
jgi:PIN domain nuclease of toxin-antitoxin system